MLSVTGTAPTVPPPSWIVAFVHGLHGDTGWVSTSLVPTFYPSKPILFSDPPTFSLFLPPFFSTISLSLHFPYLTSSLPLLLLFLGCFTFSFFLAFHFYPPFCIFFLSKLFYYHLYIFPLISHIPFLCISPAAFLANCPFFFFSSSYFPFIPFHIPSFLFLLSKLFYHHLSLYIFLVPRIPFLCILLYSYSLLTAFNSTF